MANLHTFCIRVIYKLIMLNKSRSDHRYHVQLITDDHVDGFSHLHSASDSYLKDIASEGSIIVAVNKDIVDSFINNIYWSGKDNDDMFYITQFPVLSFYDKTLPMIKRIEDQPSRQYYKYAWRLRVSNKGDDELDYGSKNNKGIYNVREFTTSMLACQYARDNNLDYDRIVIYRPATFNL